MDGPVKRPKLHVTVHRIHWEFECHLTNELTDVSSCFHQAVVLITDGSSVKTPQGLAELSRSLKEAAIKVVLVVVGDTGLENIRHLASGDKFLVTVGSPDRLKVMVQQTVDKIIQGNMAV